MTTRRKRLEVEEHKGKPPLFEVNFIDRKILDEQNIQKIGEDLFSLIDEVAPPGTNFIINFQNVDYYSAAALGKLITAHKKVNNHGGQLVFCNINDDIYETFEITRLNKLFNIQKDLPAAMQAVDFMPEAPGARVDLEEKDVRKNPQAMSM